MEDIIYIIENIEDMNSFELIIIAMFMAYWIILIYRLGVIAKEIKITKLIQTQKINDLEKKMDTLIGLSVNQLKELRSVSGALDDTEPYVIEKKDD